ncbi:MAG TPA: hypothetical protein VK327_02930, partial [Candidatus Paceibacterota bacterium]|nr:hypothetical protein [Candidatus Paceibacterota bacterium]
MKTTLPFFLLVFLVSCSHPKPAPVFSETTPTATVVKESAAAVPESVAMAKADEAEAGPSTPAIAAPEVTNEPPPVALPKPAA